MSWPKTGLFPIKVVGTHFYRDGLSRIAQNPAGKSALVFCTALLVPEHDNPYDANAVLVKVGPEKIGHLSNELARTFRARLAALGIPGQTTCCRAVITAGIETPERSYEYIVEVDLDLSTVPVDGGSAVSAVERLEPDGILERKNRNTYLVKVWLGEGALNDMHKHRKIQSWTTDNWDTINYYVLNSKGIGLGYRLFSVPKALHAKLFGKLQPVACLRSIVGRTAVVELVIRD